MKDSIELIIGRINKSYDQTDYEYFIPEIYNKDKAYILGAEKITVLITRQELDRYLLPMHGHNSLWAIEGRLKEMCRDLFNKYKARESYNAEISIMNKFDELFKE